MTPKRQPIGATPGRVTEIEVKSIELDAGQVKRKPARGARPRRWAEVGPWGLSVDNRQRRNRRGQNLERGFVHVKHVSPRLPTPEPTPERDFEAQL
ncbi:hypothetical protein FBQ82_16910 [Anaerolineae bacterium CFX7]|nr:hypothetical protein [Anaerolineae bacterium CFX7]